MVNPGSNKRLYSDALDAPGGTDGHSRSIRFRPTLSEQDWFVGSHYVFQGQVIDPEVIGWPLSGHPLFIQSRVECLADGRPEEPPLLALPLTSKPVMVADTHTRVHYRIYVDLFRPSKARLNNGIMYTLHKKTGPLSVVVSKHDRVGIGDILFVTGVLPTAYKSTTDALMSDLDAVIGDKVDVRFFVVESTRPVPSGIIRPDDVAAFGIDALDENTNTEVTLRPFRRPPDVTFLRGTERDTALSLFVLPPTIGMVGWLDTADIDGIDPHPGIETDHDRTSREDGVEQVMVRLTETIMAEYNATDYPARIHMPGITAPVQPTQFDAWKSVINVTVILSRNVVVIVDADFYHAEAMAGTPWASGDAIELQLGIPRRDETGFVHYNKKNVPVDGTVRLEVRYCRPRSPIPPRWDSLVWRCVIGRFIIEDTHPYHLAAVISLHAKDEHQYPHVYSTTN